MAESSLKERECEKFEGERGSPGGEIRHRGFSF